MLRDQRPFPVFPAFVSLAGLLFCLWVMLSGGESLCITNGCSLFQDFRLAGVSLWQAGTALFALLLLMAALRFLRAGLILARVALAADILLLGVMLFTAPCANCLIVGLLIATAFFFFHREVLPQRRVRRSPLLLLWALLFLFDVGGILRESTEPWSPLQTHEQPAVTIFFSPSCRACQTLTDQAERFTAVRWIPVAEDARDIWLIRAMTVELRRGHPLPEALALAHASIPGLTDFGTAPGYHLGLLSPEMLLLQLRLWKNQASALATGSARLPIVQFMGVPSFMREAPAKLSPGTDSSPEAPASSTVSPASTQKAPLPSGIPGIDDLGVTGFCGGPKKPGSCDNTPSSPGLIDTSEMLR